jgi:hypothetical protein
MAVETVADFLCQIPTSSVATCQPGKADVRQAAGVALPKSNVETFSTDAGARRMRVARK